MAENEKWNKESVVKAFRDAMQPKAEPSKMGMAATRLRDIIQKRGTKVG